MKKILTLLVSLYVCNASIADTITYYCPRSNESIVGDESKELVLSINSNTLSPLKVSIKDCSNWRFLCGQVAQQMTDGKFLQYLLVVPRTIRDRKEYDYHNVHIVTRRPRVNFSMIDNDHQLGTVTLWQTISGHDVAMELTFEENRGLILWDGVRFSETESMGQMCVLETQKGLFRKAKINTKL